MEKSILKNVAINFTGLVLPVFVSLLTVPIYIRGVGVERYGVINLVWALIGYFSVLDFGISAATENHIAKARGGDVRAIQRIFWSAFYLNLGTGIVGAAIVWGGTSFYVERIAAIDPAFGREVLDALPWIALSVPVANLSWMFSGCLCGMEKFVLFNVNQTIGTFLIQLVPLAAVYLISPSLAVVVPAIVIARSLAALMLAYGAFRSMRITRAFLPDRHLVWELVKYGRWLVAVTGSNAISASLDSVMIGSALGMKYVAYYAAPQSVVSRLDLLPTAMLRTLFPRFSSTSGDAASRLPNQSLNFLNFLFTPCAVLALFALEPFLHLWLGREMAQNGAPVGRVLVIGVWLTAQSSIIRVLIQAKLDPSRAALEGWVGVPVFVGMLWAGIHWGGMIGAGLAVVARSLLDYTAMLYFSKLQPRPVVRNMVGHLTFIVVALLCASSMHSLASLAATAAVIILGNIAWSLADSRELLDMILRIRRRFLAARVGPGT